MIYFELGIWLVKIFNGFFCGLYQAGKNIQKLLGGNDWKDLLLLSQLCYNLFFGTVTITFLITLLKIKHDFLCLLNASYAVYDKDALTWMFMYLVRLIKAFS